MFRFAGYELDERLAEIRGPDGAPIKLRSKTFEVLRLLVANAGRVVSKEELMEAVWRNLHVSDDSIFQCIRELRTALRDDERQLIKVVSGKGYLLAAEVAQVEAEVGVGATPSSVMAGEQPLAVSPPMIGRRVAVIGAAVVGVVALGLAIAVPAMADLMFSRRTPTVAIAPIDDPGGDGLGRMTAIAITDHLVNGLAQIEGLRVIVPEAGASLPQGDYTLRSELQREGLVWTLQTRLIETGRGAVLSTASATVDGEGADVRLVQVRLASGVGEPLARELNALIEDAQSGRARGVPSDGGGKVAIQQATAAINQTSRERFGDAQTMLKAALAAEPGNVDVQVALAALQMRGVQMVWYEPEERAAAEASAKSLLEQAVRATPRSIPVLQAYCRYLSATNQFAESLVACGRALSLNPWDGTSLYLIGVGQLYLGRFEDALATFHEAERFDTPAVSRWTFPLGIGWANLVLGRNEDAVRWLGQSIAITPGSGRTHMLQAIAYQRMGQIEDAKAALIKGMELRPGSTLANFSVPTKNASPRFVETVNWAGDALVALGLPVK